MGLPSHTCPYLWYWIVVANGWSHYQTLEWPGLAQLYKMGKFLQLNSFIESCLFKVTQTVLFKYMCVVFIKQCTYFSSPRRITSCRRPIIDYPLKIQLTEILASGASISINRICSAQSNIPSSSAAHTLFVPLYNLKTSQLFSSSGVARSLLQHRCPLFK